MKQLFAGKILGVPADNVFITDGDADRESVTTMSAPMSAAVPATETTPTPTPTLAQEPDQVLVEVESALDRLKKLLASGSERNPGKPVPEVEQALSESPADVQQVI